MVIWMLLVLGFAVLLSVGIERLMARLGVRRKEPAANGLAALAERIERWSTERMKN